MSEDRLLPCVVCGSATDPGRLVCYSCVLPKNWSRWTEQARCAKADVDKAAFTDPARYSEAKRWCHRCPVSAQCLATSRTVPKASGVWGGRVVGSPLYRKPRRTG